MNSLSLCHTAHAMLEGNKAFVIVTIMDQSGSVPRTAGARMLVGPDGTIAWGTVGGGRYEAEAISLAKALLGGSVRRNSHGSLAAHSGAVLEYSLKGVTDMDMICGGSLSLLLEVVPPDEGSRALFAAALDAEQKHQPFVFISRFTRQEDEDFAALSSASSGDVPLEQGAACGAAIDRYLYLPKDKAIIPAAKGIPAPVVAAADSLNSATPHHMAESGCDYLLELFDRPFRIIIFGGGHVSLELAKIARGVDFPVTVLDDRAEFASKERFSSAQVIVPSGLDEDDAASCLEKLHTGPQDAIVIVTRGHAHDRDVLAAALGTDAGYIGMIGSKSKRAAVYKSMMEKGFSEERIDFVHSPIGLSIGADTPQEIAVSIAAELILWRKNRREAKGASKAALIP